MNIQLTISLLVSDRMDTLERCLNSLKPLLRELDSELILIFTGKDDRVLEIARQYTPHVVSFEWCDDFAKARNAGIEEARGEWFLYLDDDEWFEDTAEIIRFFKSGEYKRYQSALYVVRNYTDWEGKGYIDSDVGRMCRLLPETKFIFPIHENLDPFPQPHKKLQCFVHHFGYLRKAGQEKKASKFDRNMKLLLERLEEEPDSAQCLMQLAMEHEVIGQYEKAIEYCERGLAAAAKRKDIYGTEVWMQCMLPRLIARTGDRKRARETAERYLKSSRTLEVAYTHQCASLVEYCYELDEYQKGLKYVQEYHRKLTFLDRHAEAAALQGCGDINYDSARGLAAVTYVQGLACAAELGNASLTAQILSWMPWENSVQMARHYTHLETWKAKYKNREKGILGAYARLKTDNAYVTLQKAFAEEHAGHTAAVEGFWKACAKDCPPGFEWQLVQMAVRNRISMKPLLEHTTRENWCGCVDVLATATPICDMEQFYQDLLPLMEGYSIYAGMLEQAFLEKQLSRGLLETSYFMQLMRRYSESVLRDARLLYCEEALRDADFYGLPSKVRFALKTDQIIRLIGQGDFAGSIRLVKEGLSIYPQMSAAVGNLTNYLADQIRTPPQVVSEEFVQLGAQVKQALKTLMEQGQWSEAYGVVGRFVAILPDDLEVLRLKQRILRQER